MSNTNSLMLKLNDENDNMKSPVRTYQDLLGLTDNSIDDIRLVIDEKTFYVYTESGWQDYLSLTDVGSARFYYESQDITTENNQEFTLKGEYYKDTNTLLIFIDGIKVHPLQYTEVSSKIVRLNQPTTGSKIEFVALIVPLMIGLSTTTTYVTEQGVETENISGDVNVKKQIIRDNDKIIQERFYLNNEELPRIKNYVYDEVGKLLRVESNKADMFLIHALAVLTNWEDDNNHTIEYEYEYNLSNEPRVKSETIKELTTNRIVKQTAYQYDENDNPIVESVTKGNKTITKNYYYNEAEDVYRIETFVVINGNDEIVSPTIPVNIDYNSEFKFIQTLESSEWIINHNLNCDLVDISVLNMDMKKIWFNNLVVNDKNSLNLIFTAPLKGVAVVKKIL